MKKILVVLLLITASMAFAQVAIFTPEEAKAFDKAHPELENPSDYYIIEERESELEIKTEKMLNLLMDKVIAILEEDNNSKEE